MEIQKHPYKSKFCKLRLLCRSLAGNNVYYLTVTAQSDEESNKVRKKNGYIRVRIIILHKFLSVCLTEYFFNGEFRGI